MLTEVAIPLTGLAVLAWLVPSAFGRILPEGVGWLALNGVLSTFVLAGIAAAGFVWLYGEAGWPALRAAPLHFAAVAARSALIWAPIMVLSLANRPRGWTTARW